jgi:hypothetical protein
MERGSNPGRSEVFRTGPETHLTFRTVGAVGLSPGVALGTHSLLDPKLKKGHRYTSIHSLCLYSMLQGEVCRYSTITFLHFPAI